MVKKLFIVLATLLLSVQSQAASISGSLDCIRDTDLSMELGAALSEGAPSSFSYNMLMSAEGKGVGREGKNSPAREALLSFLLPGMGAYRMGHTVRSKIYFGLEGISWIALGSFLWMGYAREKAYKDYAVAYAGVSGTSYSDDYYSVIGRYFSSDGPGGYNEYVRREARDMYYPDREAMDSYYEQHAYTGSMSWRWRTYDSFRKYNVLRSGSDSAYRDALYTAMFAVVVRIVSGVDAYLLASGKEGNAERDYTINFDRRDDTLRLYFSRTF